VLRALVCVAVLLSACAHAPAEEAQPPPSAPEAPRELSPLAQQVRDDLARLDAELRAPGVVSTGFGGVADLGGGLTVRPIAIVEDSRCPHNTACLWAGRMRIRAAVSGRNAELTLGEAVQTPNGTVVFAVVSPGAWAEWPSAELGPRPAHRFGFRRG